jgi:hypothetical protein
MGHRAKVKVGPQKSLCNIGRVPTKQLVATGTASASGGLGRLLPISAPIQAIWNHQMLILRIVSGWSPVDDVDEPN